MRKHPSPPRRERGIIMVIALITLAVMMIGAVAALRSMNASLTNAGNIGMKRDMANQAEVALRKAMTGLNATTDLTASNTAINYSATMLATTPEGIPNALVGSSPSTLGGLGVASNVVDLSTAPAYATTANTTAPKVTMYYVIDRLCQTTGAMDSSTCLTPSNPSQGSNGGETLPKATKPLYRVTVRVDGPRGSQSFYQATMSN